MNVQALPMHRFIDYQGNLVNSLPDWADKETLIKLYRDMVVARTYDAKAVALQRTGKLGTYPSHLGAEAIGIAIGHALSHRDVFIPYYRDMPAMWVRGIPMEKTFNTGGVTNAEAILSLPTATIPVLTCHSACPLPPNALMRSALQQRLK
ncbi:branched-chain alpha-keto acid dehydrogenase [Vibrio variabilis]|uniref:2-oxoisovalerate dehydrogenase subunit alpha n=1 Tax=Vibrio variabilis TaxID=990271 RepID=A0ABQ0JMF4_9VIBR|nr:branched-chain alpha-keto acid dehydrogenase [Vibrio variabilis]